MVLSFPCTEVKHGTLYVEVEDVVVWFKAMADIAGCIEWWRKPPHARHHSAGKPVGHLLLSGYIETGKQFAARFQRA